MGVALLLGGVRTAGGVELTMPMRRSVDPGTWDELFNFLDPERAQKHGVDRNRAAEEALQAITRKLVHFFGSRGCVEADDLATETVMRVAVKCHELSGLPSGERAAYIFGVARNVLREWARGERRESAGRESAAKEPTLAAPADAQARETAELKHRCLDRCLATLSRGARKLILEYYGAERAAKIATHRQLADHFGKSINALRIEIHRIRTTLRRCVFECTHQQPLGLSTD